MNENKKCPKCGATIAPEWKHELCPACLMQAGFATGDSAQGSPPVRASGDEATKASENTHAPPPNAPLSIEDVRKLFPQLEIIEQIGRGGMGVVYKARQPQLDRMVALKILSVGPGSSGANSGFAERFSREARALARLNHPNIISVFDYGVTASPPSQADGGTPSLHGGIFYFIMEFVDGLNLRQMIAAKQITPETALTIVPKVCEALQFAHDEGILHRDIKPENILIDKKGRVKIADFGLAKLVGDDTVDHSLTGTQQIMGTPRYMAPEQFENTKTVDHRADIYSLGVVFYEMLTGEIPMGRFALPSKKVQVDVRIDEVVLRSLEREPSQRYQHVSEVKTGVENVTLHGGPGVMASPPSLPKHAAIGAKTLLDDIDPLARRRQQQGLFAGALFLFAGVWLMASLRIPPAAIAAWVGSAFLFVVAFRTKQQCVLDYLGHSIQVETTLLSVQLKIDGKTVASGAIGPGIEFSGRIADGVGTGDRIIARNYRGFLSYRCRLFVEPANTSQLPRTGNSAGANFQSLEPQLCNLSVISSVWAAVGLACAAFVSIWIYGNRGVPPWVMLIGLLGLISIICAPITGAVAISRIRRSNGRLTGLPFAAFGLLCYPMLLLGALTAYFTNLIAFTIMFNLHGPVSPSSDGSVTVWNFATLDILVAVVVCFFAARVAWRKIAGPQLPTTGHSAQPNFQSLEKQRTKNFLGLPLWGLAVATALLAFVAVYLPKPGDLPEPRRAEQIFRPYLLLTPENNSYRFVGYENGEWKKHAPVFNVNRMVTARQEVTRTFGWDSRQGPSFGFFQRDGRWTYALVGNHFDFKVGDKLLEFPPAQLKQLRPMVVTQMDLIEPGKGARLTRLLDQGENASTYVCWQNAVVLAAWISAVLLVFAFAKFLFTTRVGRITLCVVAGLIVLAIPFFTVKISPARPMSAQPQPNLPVERVEAVAAKDTRFEIAMDRSQLPTTATPGRQDFGFKFSGPENYTLNVWLEFWKDGRLEIDPKFDEQFSPRRADSISASLRLTMMDGDVASVESAGKTRFDWELGYAVSDAGNAARIYTNGKSLGSWRTNIFKNVTTLDSSSDRPGDWHPMPGQTVTLLALCGYRSDNLGTYELGWSETSLLKGWPNAAILLRARFDPVVPGELGEGPVTKSGATDQQNRKMTFAQFTIGKLIGADLSHAATPAEAHKALVAATASAENILAVKKMTFDLGAGGAWQNTASPDEQIVRLEAAIDDVTGGKKHFVAEPGGPLMIGENGPELHTDAIKKLKLSKLQADEINRIMQSYHRNYLALERRHTKIGKDAHDLIVVTIEPFSDECQALAQKLVAELGGIADFAILPKPRVGQLPTQIFRWGGECKQTITLWKTEGNYRVEEKHSDCVTPRDPYSFFISGANLESIPAQYRIYWHED